jgi:hypothetical protein
MPIPFDRFRYLNGTGKPQRVVNYSGHQDAEVQFDDQPPVVLPMNGDMPVPPETQEIGVRRMDESAPPIEIALVVES